MATQNGKPIDVPRSYPCSTIFLDESGVKARDRFTVGGFKIRRVGDLSRAVRHVRDTHGFYGKFKFNDLNDGSVDFAYDLRWSTHGRHDSQPEPCAAGCA